jgi:hypothetical protein
MNQESLNSKKVTELILILQSNRVLYYGYSKYKRKQDMINFILSKNPVLEEHNDIGDILYSMFLEPDDFTNELFLNRPMHEKIDEKISEIETMIKRKNKDNSVVFDNHNDEGFGNMYSMFKHNHYNKYRELGEEMILFHGTDEENISDILESGFSLTISVKHGNIYGKGIYFTNDINKALSYSEKSKNEKYVIVCIVHIGDIIQGERNMGIHPKMQDKNKRYDTSVDNLHNPIQFIKKDNYTYNILGVLSFKFNNNRSHLVNNNNRSHLVNNNNRSHLVINNNSYNTIWVYWIPCNVNIYDLDVISKGKKMGEVLKGNAYSLLTHIGHKFMCTNSTDCIRIIEITKKKENISINGYKNNVPEQPIQKWTCKALYCNKQNNDDETKCNKCKKTRYGL